MIYLILKYLFSFTVKGYFRSITIRNLDRIPSTGPVIFVANHTSAFMDSIVLAIHIPRKMHFLARGESFLNPVTSAILSRLNAIPIYRPEYTPDEVFRNEEIFQRCYDHLAAGKCIIIFPEGISKTERRLRKIKTGTARIALGAEAQNDFKLGVTILPIGINYSNPHFFQSDLFLNIGNPITVEKYQDEYHQDHFQAAQTMTNDIKTALEKRTVVIRDEELDHLIRNIEKIFRGQLRETVGEKEQKLVQNFYLSREIVNAVSFFYKKDRQRVLGVIARIQSYLDKMKEWELRDSQLRGPAKDRKYLLKLLFLVCTFPLFALGFINNYLPFKVAEAVSGILVKREDFRGSIQLTLGAVIFLIFYIIQISLVAMMFHPGIALVYMVLLYPSGLFALKYVKDYLRIQKRIKFIRLFLNKGSLVTSLAIERQGIIDSLERGRIEYLKAMKDQSSQTP